MSKLPIDFSELKPKSLGDCTINSPLIAHSNDHKAPVRFVRDDGGVIFNPCNIHRDEEDQAFHTEAVLELAGPRKKIYFDPNKTKAAIVACGGLCPGINDVVRGLVMTLFYRYGVKDIYGVPYGFQGFIESYGHKRIDLTPELVSPIHRSGGSILASSRGQQNSQEILKTLRKWGVNALFVIGGDGTQRAANEIAELAIAQNMDLSVVGIPKTIDNDIPYMDKSFGFETAFSEGVKSITCAHNEARGNPNGIGIVKLMGRHSGFIACHAALAMNDANYVLIPEVLFKLEGRSGFLPVLFERLRKRGHAVIVVAEGAGQDLMDEEMGHDASGNKVLGDIGIFLKHKMNAYAKSIDMEVNIKYIDPSYIIRGVVATPQDALYCLILAENAVHAAMSGRTKVVIGRLHGFYVNLPMVLISQGRKRVNPRGYLWNSVLAATGQPTSFL